MSKFINFQNSHGTNRSVNVGIWTFFPMWGCTAVLPHTEVETCGKGQGSGENSLEKAQEVTGQGHGLPLSTAWLALPDPADPVVTGLQTISQAS